MQTPLIISSQLVTLFKFWQEGQVRTGMRFRNELFQAMGDFAVVQRQKAFELAWQLSQQHNDVIVITVSATHYCIWLNIRAPVCSRSSG